MRDGAAVATQRGRDFSTHHASVSRARGHPRYAQADVTVSESATRAVEMGTEI